LFNLDIFDASAPCTLFCGANMIAEENKGKKKKFKEGQAEQVLDDLFFEAIKGVERLKPSTSQPANLYPIDEPPAPAKKLKTFSLFF
jgi:DNA (cytosine-5)-methyltransferase 1